MRRSAEPVELLTPEEVADALRLKVGTLRSWRYRGEGPPYIKVAGSHQLVRYPAADFRSWLEQYRQNGAVA